MHIHNLTYISEGKVILWNLAEMWHRHVQTDYNATILTKASEHQ